MFSVANPQTSSSGTQGKPMNTVPTAWYSVFGSVKLMPEIVTGAGTRTLLDNSCVKFKWRADGSRLEKRLVKNVCVSYVFGIADTLCSLKFG